MTRPFAPIYAVTVMVVLLHVSFGASRILLSLYAIALDAQTYVIGILVALYSVPPLLLSVMSGRMSDRVGHRRPMLYGAVVLVLALLVPWLAPGLPALFASAILAGGSFSFFNVAAQALAGALSTRETRAFNFSTLSMGYSISALIGPLVVGYSVEFFGPVRAYAVLAALVVLPIAILIFKGAVFDVKGGGTEEGVPRSVVDLLRNRGLMAMFLASGACVTGWDLFSFFMPIYGTSIGLSASQIGIVISTFGVATLVVRVFIPRLSKRFGNLGLLKGAMFLGAAMFALLPFLRDQWTLMAVSFVMGLGLGCGQPLTMLITYGRSPSGRAGEANGVRQMANHVTHIVVPLIFGALGSVVGMGPVFWSNTLLLMAGAWVGGRRYGSSAGGRSL